MSSNTTLYMQLQAARSDTFHPYPTDCCGKRVIDHKQFEVSCSGLLPPKMGAGGGLISCTIMYWVCADAADHAHCEENYCEVRWCKQNNGLGSEKHPKPGISWIGSLTDCTLPSSGPLLSSPACSSLCRGAPSLSSLETYSKSSGFSKWKREHVRTSNWLLLTP